MCWTWAAALRVSALTRRPAPNLAVQVTLGNLHPDKLQDLETCKMLLWYIQRKQDYTENKFFSNTEKPSLVRETQISVRILLLEY